MITVRELRHDDELNGVLALCREFFDEYEAYDEELFDLDNLTDADISGRFLESLDSDSSATVVALDGDRIVGYALLAVREQPGFYKVKRIGTVAGLMVASGCRRRGIGTRLLNEIKAYYRKKGIKYFTLYTSVANQGAIRFYERNGMSTLHTTFLGEA
jgi:ribosomal protein S18 acetylase RimI-like enzyme